MHPSPMHCAMTGVPLTSTADGIWDEGEWISWEYINRQLGEADEDEREDWTERVRAHVVKSSELQGLIRRAIIEEERTPLPSPLWGQIGELCAAECYPMELVRAHAQGHDAKLGTELVEVKTITPRKARPFVRVKRSGNFSLLAVVRVSKTYELYVKLVRRKDVIKKSDGEYAIVTWARVCAAAEYPPGW